jgi:hypothetical protein
MFVDREVIEDHDVARAQRRHQDLLDVGEKRRMVDRAIEHGRGAESVAAERGHNRMGLPMAARRVIAEARAARTPAIPSEQIGRHPTFIEEDVLADLAQRLPRPPLAAGRGDIRPTLLVGVYGFF